MQHRLGSQLFRASRVRARSDGIYGEWIPPQVPDREARHHCEFMGDRVKHRTYRSRPFFRALLVFFCSWIVFLSVLLIVYFSWLREWQMNWGATTEEVNRYMIGDELLDDPDFNTTRVVEINAPVEQVWPWIVQMGYGRGGFYAFDHLDNAGKPSADRIMPEYQHLEVGDFILPLLQVAELEPPTSMLWLFLEGAGGWENATWSWGLYRTENNTTRLVSRLRQTYVSSSLRERMMWGFQEITEIFMMRTCLRGIKYRVEQRNRDQAAPIQ
jgi:hypothetical protein